MSERRARAVDAYLDLVLEGHLPPSIEQVASRSGISVATLFRYFENLDELRNDGALRALERFPRHFAIPEVGIGPREERVRRFAGIRVEFWETTHFLARLLRSTALQDPGSAEMVAFARKARADQIRTHFARELRALTQAEREDAVATIASLTSVESWEQFRNAYHRSPAQIQRAWSRAIDRILRDHLKTTSTARPGMLSALGSSGGPYDQLRPGGRPQPGHQAIGRRGIEPLGHRGRSDTITRTADERNGIPT